MNAREANVFLTKTALLDGRFRRTPEEQADMAVEWAEVLVDVALATAVEALRQHYRAEVRAITPADVRMLAADIDDQAETTTTDARERAQRDAWLREHRIDPAEFDRLVNAGTPPARILQERGVDLRELTA